MKMLRDPETLAATVAARTGKGNGGALDERQRAKIKEEIRKLLKPLTSPEAESIRKLMELL